MLGMIKDRVLVTGASGFVGQATVTTLLQHGLRVNLAVREAVHMPWPVDNERIKVFVTGDLATEDFSARLGPAFANVRTVVHLAGLAHTAKGDRANAGLLFFRSNTLATRNLVEMATIHGASSFIHLSSLAAVTNNSSASIITDDTNFSPQTSYGQSKLMAEAEVRRLADRGLFAISLRPPLIIGARARGNWNALQKLACTGLPLPFGSLHFKRNFVSIQTITDAICTLCNTMPASSLSGNYCIADPDPLSVLEVVTALREGMRISPRLFNCPRAVFEIVGKLSGRQRQLSGLIGRLEVNSSRFYENFSFRPSLPILEAVRRSGAEYVARTIM